MGGAVYVSEEELSEAIGTALTARVLAVIGGRIVYVPGEPDPGNEIEKSLGHEDFAKLRDYIRTSNGGMWVEFPLGRAAQEARRQAMMLKVCSDMSKSETKLARELGVHSRTVRRWRSRARRSSLTHA